MHLQHHLPFDVTLVGEWGQVTRIIAQDTLHHVTHAPAKFDVATPNCLRTQLQEK